MQGGGTSFFDGLTIEERDRFRDVAVARSVAPGTRLALEGDRANRVWILERGLVKISSVRSDGLESILALRGPGDVVGELAVLDDGNRSSTITAVTHTEFLSLPGASFLDLVARSPQVSRALLHELVQRLRRADEHRVSYASDDVPARLAACLLELGRRHGTEGSDGRITIELPLTQLELAGMVAASRDAVARTLQRWRAQALAETYRRRIVLLDPAGLARRYRQEE